MKVCFTINCMRTKSDFVGYNELIKKGLFQGVEIFYPYNVSLEQRKLYEEELSKLLNDNNLEVVLHLPHGGNNNFINEDLTVNEEIVKRMQDAVEFGSKYNAHKFTLHLGSSFKGKVERSSILLNVIDEVKKLCNFAKKYDAYIMIENMPRDNELGYGVKEMEYILNTISKDCDNIKFILDTGHAHVSSDDDVRYIYDLHQYLYHMHFSDNNGLRDEHKGFHLGNIDFDSVFLALARKYYNELHCLEIIFNDYKELIKNQSDIMEYNKYYELWKDATVSIKYYSVARANFNDDFIIESHDFKIKDLIDKEFNPFCYLKKVKMPMVEGKARSVKFIIQGDYPYFEDKAYGNLIVKKCNDINLFTDAIDYDQDNLLVCKINVTLK